MFQKFADEKSTFKEWNPEKLTKEEAKYYKQVVERINSKMEELS